MVNEMKKAPLGGSKLGRKPIVLPSGVEARLEGSKVFVKSSKAELFCTVNEHVTVDTSGGQIMVKPVNLFSKEGKAYHGLFSRIIRNLVIGVFEGFTKNLMIVGTGYRAKVNGKQLEINLGYSHPVSIAIPEGISCSVEENTKIVLKGASKEALGQFAADIRKKRSPEPYKGKGIRYENEVIKRKAGKSGKAKK
jgi:large subunit ribosomal protein L6